MILAATNRKAGAAIATGVFLFLLAVGVNTLYSFESVCLDILPPQCYSGYDALSTDQQLVLTPGLYFVAFSVIVLGVILWFRRDRVFEKPRD
jgi:hypothetical protein